MRNPRTLGLLANFEQAFRACSGDWIAPCDQDDIWRPNKLSRLLAAADAKTALVYGDSLLIDAHGRAIDDARGGNRVSGRYRMISGSDPRMFALSNCISGHAALVRRQVVERALPLPDGVSYDAWIAFVAANVGMIRYVDEPLVEFRQHERNASGFTGQLKQAPRSERDKREAERRHIEALASFAGSQQTFFKRLLGLWEQRTKKTFTPALALFLYRHRETVFAMKTSRPGAKGRHALKYLRGAKLADGPEL
jgi:glycosyltransferase involved in cell wall biosynthesis